MKLKMSLLAMGWFLFHTPLVVATCGVDLHGEREEMTHKKEVALMLRHVWGHVHREEIIKVSRGVMPSRLQAVREAGFPAYAKDKILTQGAAVSCERLPILAKLIFHGGAYVDYGRIFHEIDILPDALFTAIAQGGFWARHLNLIFDQVHVEGVQARSLTPAHMAPLGTILRALHSSFDPRAVIQEAAALPAEKLNALAQASYQYSAYTLFVLAHAKDLEVDDITRLKAVFG